jgi:poly(3-hydroxybutyrate) depolymerase
MSDNIGYENATYKFENFDLHHNYTVNNGYGWSHQRPNKDANFVYGGTNTNSTQHVNSVFHDNVNMFASSVGLKMRYTIGEPHGHTFRDNVYIMHHGLRFANSASVVEGVVGENMQYYFNVYGIDLAVKAGIDTNSKFRYVLEDGSLGVIDETNGVEATRPSLEEYIKYNPHYTFTASSGNSYPVNIIKPENFKANKSYPLIVYLHAEYQGGDNGTAHVLNNNPVIQNLYTESTEDDAIILAMQLPKDATWTGTGKRDKVYKYDATATPAAIADLNELVDLMLANEGGVNINAKKISVVGQSNGGTAVYDILTRYPDKYSRAAIAGASVAENVSIGSTELKIFHGGKDVFFKEAEVKKFAGALSGNVSYKSFAQEDHNVWSSSFDRELCMWLIGK